MEKLMRKETTPIGWSSEATIENLKSKIEQVGLEENF
jgi:hypothetical protein